MDELQQVQRRLQVLLARHHPGFGTDAGCNRASTADAKIPLNDAHSPTSASTASAASRVHGLLGWICWGDDVDGTWPRVSGTGVVLMPERHIRVQRRMAASADSVWALFADFPNLASHWSGLRATRAIGDQTGGVGARRRVELKPIGSMEETVTIWEEGRRIDTQNLPSASVPFKHAESTLTLEPDAEGTLATFDYRYVPRGGPFGGLAGPLIDKMLMRTFTDMLAAMDGALGATGSER
jgi:hypothetical protein